MQRMQVDLEAAQSAKTRLETDNLALYSKIRYLQSYGGGGGSQMYKSPQVHHLTFLFIFCTYK